MTSISEVKIDARCAGESSNQMYDISITIDQLQQELAITFNLQTAKLVGLPKAKKSATNPLRLCDLELKKSEYKILVLGQKRGVETVADQEERIMQTRLAQERHESYFKKFNRKQQSEIERHAAQLTKPKVKPDARYGNDYDHQLVKYQIAQLEEYCIKGEFQKALDQLNFCYKIRQPIRTHANLLELSLMGGCTPIFRHLVTMWEPLPLDVFTMSHHAAPLKLAAKYGRLDAVQFILEEFDHLPAFKTRYPERCNALTLGSREGLERALSEITNEAFLAAAVHAHLPVCIYLLDRLKKDDALAYKYHNDATVAAATNGDVCMLQELTSGKWCAFDSPWKESDTMRTNSELSDKCDYVPGVKINLYTVVDAAIKSKQLETFQFCLQRGARLEKNNHAMIRAIAENGFYDALVFLHTSCNIDAATLLKFDEKTRQSNIIRAAVSSKWCRGNIQQTNAYKDLVLYLWNTCQGAHRLPDMSSAPDTTFDNSAWAFLQDLQFEREHLEKEAEICGRALSGIKDDIHTLGLDVSSQTDTPEDEYLPENEYLLYPLDLARMIAKSIHGTEGLNVNKCVQDGEMMFGIGWKEEFIRSKEADERRETARQSEIIRQAEQSREALMVSLLGHDSNLTAPTLHSQ